MGYMGEKLYLCTLEMYDYQPINKDSYEKNRFVIALFLCRLAGSTGGDPFFQRETSKREKLFDE